MYQVSARFHGIKKSRLSAASEHNSRAFSGPHIDTSRTCMNRCLIGSGDATADVARIVAAVGKEARSDTTAAEGVLSAHHLYFEEIAPGWQEGGEKLKPVLAWAEANRLELLKKWPPVAGVDQVASLDLHLDELAPHLHVMIVPISLKEIKTGRGGVAVKQVMRIDYRSQFSDTVQVIAAAREAGRKDVDTKLGRLQTWYAEAMQSHGYQLERGIVGSTATHEKVKDYYKAIARGHKDVVVSDKRSVEKVIKTKKEKGFFEEKDTGLYSKDAVEKYGDTLRQDMWTELQPQIKDMHARSVVYEKVKGENQRLKEEIKEKTKIMSAQAAEIRDLRAMADVLRPLPIVGVMDALGYMYNLVEEGYWTEKGLVTIKGETVNVVDWPDRQPRNAIDLVKIIRSTDYEGALAVLSAACGPDGSVALAAAAARDIQPAAPADVLHRNEYTWRHARDYLIQIRKIPAEIVDKAHAAGAVWADDDKNACFGLGRTFDRGVELRGTIGGMANGFHGTRGVKEPFFLRSLQPNSKKIIVVVESAIEAMSFQAQHPDVFIMSTGGSNYTVPLGYIDGMNKQGYKIITAFNNDPAGDKHRAAFKAVSVGDMKPDGKDWNIDLRNNTRTPLPVSATIDFKASWKAFADLDSARSSTSLSRGPR